MQVQHRKRPTQQFLRLSLARFSLEDKHAMPPALVNSGEERDKPKALLLLMQLLFSNFIA